MADNKKNTPMNTVAIGVAAAMGVVVYSNLASDESIGMRIGSSILAFVVTAAVAIGVLTLIRKLSDK